MFPGGKVCLTWVTFKTPKQTHKENKDFCVWKSLIISFIEDCGIGIVLILCFLERFGFYFENCSNFYCALNWNFSESASKLKIPI